LDPDALHANHGSFGAVPRVVQEHQNVLRAEMDADPVLWFCTVAPRIVEARRLMAGFVGADPGATAFVPNVSAGASTVFQSLSADPGPSPARRDIVVTDHGYGAVTMGAQRAAHRWGGTVIRADVPLAASAEEVKDIVMSRCSDTTRLIVVDQITSPTARHFPVREISAAARARDILTLVDGAHAPGLVAAPIQDLDCDYWIGNLHKWPCAPRGAALLVARPGHGKGLFPLIDSWGTPLDFPERFDVQGTLDYTSYLAAPTAAAFIEGQWGWPALRKYMSRLADYAESVIADAFSSASGEDHLVDVGAPVPAMRLVRLPSGLGATREEADRLRDRLVYEERIATAFTSFNGVGYLRLSVHAYNTPQDFEHLADRLVPVLSRWMRERRA
jgi:isopenicillin-N epimerase